MSNRDKLPRGRKALVARDDITTTPGAAPDPESVVTVHTPSEAFARAIKGVFGPGLPRRDPPGQSAESPSVVTGLAEGTALEGVAPSISSLSTASGLGGPALDLAAVRPELGYLLAADPVPPLENHPAESVAYPRERQDPLVGSAPDVAFALPVSAAGTRQPDQGLWAPGVRSQSLTASSGGSSGATSPKSQGAQARHPGLLELASLATSETSERGGEGYTDFGRMANVRTAAGISGEGKTVGLPGANPVADQLAFAEVSTGSANRASGEPSYAVDIPESSAALSAFGTVLSGLGASGASGTPDRLVPGVREDVGRLPPSFDTWSGRADIERVDQAGSPPLDLSKTNDLLQQLLEEVRKGRQPFLPLNDRNSPGYASL